MSSQTSAPSLSLVTESGQVWTTDIGGRYAITQATSPAAAQVTGIVTLLQQAYHQRHGAGENLPPALAEGLLIHSAVDVVEANWYRLNFTNNVFDTKTSARARLHLGLGLDRRARGRRHPAVAFLHSQRGVQDGLVQQFETSVAASSTLKVTLIWTDPPATVGAAQSVGETIWTSSSRMCRPGRSPTTWILDKAFPMEPAQPASTTSTTSSRSSCKYDATVPQSYRISVRGSAVPLEPQPFFVLSSFPLAVVMYGTPKYYNGDLGGRAGADAKCLAEARRVWQGGQCARGHLHLDRRRDARHAEPLRHTDGNARHQLEGSAAEGFLGVTLGQRDRTPSRSRDQPPARLELLERVGRERRDRDLRDAWIAVPVQ